MGSANWTKFPNCEYPPVPGLPGSPTPDTLEFKDPSLLRFDVAPNPETRCHQTPIVNAPVVMPIFWNVLQPSSQDFSIDNGKSIG